MPKKERQPVFLPMIGTKTVHALIDPRTKRGFKQARAYFPLTARKGGVLVRAGHTKALLI
jgi:3,4-dihydroxy-2-butanone 4-phosphate synthase